MTTRAESGKLIRAVTELDCGWVVQNSTGHELEAVKQAKYFAEHPEDAQAAYEEFHRWKTPELAVPPATDSGPTPEAHSGNGRDDASDAS